MGTKRILLQSNHGPMICGETMDIAFDYLVRDLHAPALPGFLLMMCPSYMRPLICHPGHCCC